jgi:5-methyltetrahydropteroyltriglutamate--homocysteine methyltransferase
VEIAEKEIGLGVVNPRTDEVESVDTILASVRRALVHVPAARLFLNPDCGFGTFATRPVNSPEVAVAKLTAIVRAAEILRAEAPAPRVAAGP